MSGTRIGFHVQIWINQVRGGHRSTNWRSTCGYCSFNRLTIEFNKIIQRFLAVSACAFLNLALTSPLIQAKRCRRGLPSFICHLRGNQAEIERGSWKQTALGEPMLAFCRKLRYDFIFLNHIMYHEIIMKYYSPIIVEYGVRTSIRPSFSFNYNAWILLTWLESHSLVVWPQIVVVNCKSVTAISGK